MRTVPVSGETELGPERPRSSVEDAAIWRRFRGAAGDDVRIGTFQRLKLTPPAQQIFSEHLVPVSDGDKQRGLELLSGEWRFGEEVQYLKAGEAPWRVALPTKHFADRLHTFGWLEDLLSAGDEGRARAGVLLDDWNEIFGRPNGFAWRLDPLSQRTWHHLLHAHALLDGASPEVRRTRLDALWRQVRFLAGELDGSQDPKTRWMGAAALAAAAICFRGGQGVEEAMARLEAEVTAQILPDGGHVSRSPSRLLEALKHLLVLKRGLLASAQVVPEWMDRQIPRLAGMVSFFRAGDGALLAFNDSEEARAEEVSAVLAHLEGVRRFLVAPKSGFQKMERGRLRLILDCGECPPRPFSEAAHSGALGFEFSDGAARIVTSMGFSPDVNVDRQAQARSTKSHSTLILAGRDSGAFTLNDDSRLHALQGPEGISAKRLEESDDVWLDAQHGGYKSAYGLLHRRRLFMAADGERLTGEDSLARPVSQAMTDERKPIPFEIRFHLHPSVTAMSGRDGIRLMCDTGTVWLFKTSHEGARLDRTIYLSRGRIERTEQIVLAGFADPNSDGLTPPNCIRWTFIREAAE